MSCPISALKNQIQQKKIKYEQTENDLAGILLVTHNWLMEHREEIHHAQLDVLDDTLRLVIIQNSTKYDPEFQDKATDLDIQLNQDFPQGLYLEVLVLPLVGSDSKRSFVSRRAARWDGAWEYSEEQENV